MIWRLGFALGNGGTLHFIDNDLVHNIGGKSVRKMGGQTSIIRLIPDRQNHSPITGAFK